MILYTVTAANIGFNLRVRFVHVVLEQDISTLDEINSKFIEGATKVINTISTMKIELDNQLGQAVQLTSVIVSTFIIAFARSSYNLTVHQWALADILL